MNIGSEADRISLDLNNRINSCGLNSNNQTTAASNKIRIEEEGIIVFIHHDMLKLIVLQYQII